MVFSSTPNAKAALAVFALTLVLPSQIVAAQSESSLESPNAARDPRDESKTVEPYWLGETIVTATRSDRASLETPFASTVISSDLIKRRSYRTTPQILRDTPGVMVQETSNGQGSPIIRGFTGYHNLFLIDGIRLNNSVMRAGPNQYWNTVDPLAIDRLEIVKGPGSVLWGSDSIGGTVNAITKNPSTYGSGLNVGAEQFGRHSSAENSAIGRVEISTTADDWFGVLLGATGKNFRDMEGGRDTGTQPNTGYQEWDADFKLESFGDPDTRVVVAYQHVKQNDVPRTHRTIFSVPFKGTTIGSDLRRDLDQERELGYVQLHGENQAGFFDRYSLSFSWHNQEESRDRIRSNGNPQFQGFEAGTLGLFANLGSETSLGRMTYGFDFYRDQVDSFSSSNSIQGPVADDARYDLFGVFVQNENDLNEDLTLTLGARWNYASADADRVFDPVGMSQISIEDSWSSLVGSARFLYRLDGESANLFGGVSQGFRAPNLSDLTRFDSARTNEFEIPSPGLEPEQYLSLELGVKTQTERLATGLACFYTDIQDQIVRFPTGNINLAGDFEITKGNVGDGYVYGVEAGAAWELCSEWTAFGNATFIEGKVETFPSSAPVISEEYIDRLMPFTAQLGTRWEDSDQSKWFEAVSVYADDADKLSTRDQGDTSRIPPGGTPHYIVFHLRAGYRVNNNVTLAIALENLLDEDYRVHGSGQNMPGRSLILALTGVL